MAGDIPDEVRRFVAAHIDSASLLEVLLLLRAESDRTWTPAEAGKALVSGEAVARGHLDQLTGDGLAQRSGEGYRYAPKNKAGAVDALADTYARRRHTVIALIYGSDTRQASTIADAFTLRRRKR